VRGADLPGDREPHTRAVGLRREVGEPQGGHLLLIHAHPVVGDGGPRNEADIWLISLREGDPPVNLTRDDPSEMLEYSLSPDGRYVVYPAIMPRGSSIWRIDLRQ